MTKSIFSALLILLLSHPALAAQPAENTETSNPSEDTTQATTDSQPLETQPATTTPTTAEADAWAQADGSPMFGPDMRFTDVSWVFGLSGGLASQLAHLSSTDVAQDPADGTHFNLNLLVGVDLLDFVQLLTTFELSLDNQKRGYDWATNDYDETIPNYIRAGLRLGVTALRVGDLHVRTGIDGFYKRISNVKSAPGELCLDPSACDTMGTRRVKHEGFGFGAVVGLDYILSRQRDRPEFSVGVDCRTDYNMFSEPVIQDSVFFGEFHSEVGAPSTLEFGCQAGFKYFYQG